MVDEQQPAKRVVKKVVKKTVVRPSSAASSPAPIRYGRPVATAKPQAKVPARPGSRPVAKAAPRTKVPRERRSVDVRARAASTRAVAGRAWWATADTVSAGARTAGGFVAVRARAVAAWRLPHINLYLASVITGAVVGLVAVMLGVATLAIFDAVRGVSSGGGLWGGLAFTAVAVVSLFLGEALLRGFGSHAARLTSFLAILLTIIAMLGLFLDVIDSSAAVLLVPLLGIATYALSHWLVDLAENAPTVVE